MRLLIPVILFLSLLLSEDYEDVIYLKNGSIIHGTIIEIKPNEYYKIKSDRNIFIFKLEEIELIKKEFLDKESNNKGKKLRRFKRSKTKEENLIRNQSGIYYDFIHYDKAPRLKIPLSDLIVYPELALEAEIEGKIFVKAFINTKGIVTATEIVKGLPNTSLNEAALNAIKKSRWHPARKRNKKVGVWITIPVDFSLTK